MTDAAIAAIAAIIPSTLAAFGTLYVSIRTGTIEKKTDALTEKTIEIHTLTNGNLSKMTAALEVANQKISGLQALIAALDIAKLDTIAAAAAPSKGVAATTDAAASLHDVLARIEDRMSDTAKMIQEFKNTSRLVKP